jgi:hypothetical protein
MMVTCSGRYRDAAMMIIERKRKRNESIFELVHYSSYDHEKGEKRKTEGEDHVLKMNFSVGVSIYSENVTSYW